MRATTTDLYEAAYLMTEGAQLTTARKEGRNGRALTVFELEGEGLEPLRRAFEQGDALCNVAHLRSTLNRLKDVIFGLQREQERSRTCHESPRKSSIG